MKRNKGFIMSTYVYILLTFFLLMLGTMLLVMNNTKLLSNRIKDDYYKSATVGAQYTITLDGNGASTPGTSSIMATGGSSVLPSITNPQKSYNITYNANESGATLSKNSDTLNYIFDGWYTEQEGGSKVINESGNLIANISTYTNGDAKWIRGEDTTLYAHWTSNLTLAAITKTGYICGFAETSDGEYAYGSAEVNPNITSDKTLYVKCEKEDYAYSGNYELFTAPKDGYYKVELWGAEGGNVGGTSGKGAYISGYIYMNKGEIYYVYVGERVATYADRWTFNGGGRGSYSTQTSNDKGANGGGATDIRCFGNVTPTTDQLVWNSELGLNSRIMVAAGGGGTTTWGNGNSNAGNGGTLVGANGTNHATDGSTNTSTGGTQTSGGVHTNSSDTNSTNGSFGQGGTSNIYTNGWIYVSGGGGGYYGGGAGSAASHVIGSASGGSSFISGYAGVNAITSSSDRTHTNNTLHYSGKYFIKGSMTAGNRSGNGQAKITYVGETLSRTNTNLNNVRYIKDCMNGNSANTANHWVELQAIKDGINVAKGITITGISNKTAYPLNRITDGDITSANYAEDGVNTTGNQCITVDLGSTYDLDEITIWHYWADGRTYNNNVTSVSSDNENWTTVINTTAAETANGKRVSAY